MSGRAATVNVIPGKYALSVGRADMPAPRGWHWVSLGDVARLESGHTPSREHPEYWDGGVPWIGIKDARVHHGAVISETFQTVTEEGLDNSAARLLPPSTVCLSRTASVGYVVVMGREMATSQDFVNWICGPAIEPHFLKQLFIAENESLFRFGKGSTHTTIYYPEVKAFYVCLPPVIEQRRIVAKLEALQARSRRAREALEAVPPLLEKLRQSILAAAFRGDLTKDWREKHPDVEPASELLKRIRIERRKKWEEAELAKMKAKGKTPADDRWKAKYVEPKAVDATGLPELPRGWSWVSAIECAHDITVGHVGPMEHRYVPTGIPFLRSQNVRANRFDPTELRYIPPDFHAELSKSRLSPGDLVIVRSGAPGTACVIPDELGDANCADLVVARLVSFIDPHVIAFYMNSAWARGAVRDAQVGVAQQHFNVGAMRTLHLPLMPIEEQAALRTTLQDALDALAAQSRFTGSIARDFSRLERTLLAKAFRGELVPQDPDDEPAEVMLERMGGQNGVPKTAVHQTKPKGGRPSPARREELS